MQRTDDSLAVRVRGLTKRYGPRPALDQLDLDVRRGECLGLLGPNGAGKSTTVRILATLTARDAGQVEVLGADPARDAAAVRRRIGVVPQELAVYDELSARENLEFFGGLHGLSGAVLRAAVERGLEHSGLAARAGERVKAFSGGMKRRLNLAVAFLHEPELVFLDEPMVGVDPQSRQRVFEMVDALRSGGTTLVYTSHQMDEVERLCDRIAILDRGRSVAVGTLAELRALPAVRAEGEARLVLSSPAELDRARAALAAAGVAYRDESHGAGLEEVFLALTGRALRDGGDAVDVAPDASQPAGARGGAA